MRAVRHVETDMGRQRQHRGHRISAGAGWDEMIQRNVDDDCLAEGPWQLAALDREYWGALEQTFVAHVLRRTGVPRPLVVVSCCDRPF